LLLLAPSNSGTRAKKISGVPNIWCAKHLVYKTSGVQNISPAAACGGVLLLNTQKAAVSFQVFLLFTNNVNKNTN
jgi:hypothetical protein